MGKWKIYTPEGVKDQLPNNCYLKRNIEKSLREYFGKCGFLEIETPAIEFYDTFMLTNKYFSQDTMYKFSDARGRLLVLRPDMTIPTARMVATKMNGNTSQQQYFYIGDCFNFKEVGGGRLSENTQAGVELLGAEGVIADAQVILTAIEAVLMTGITEFQIDIGQVEFFKGIMEQAGIDGEELEVIRKLIDSKDFIGLERRLNNSNLNEDIKKLCLNLPSLFGTIEVLDELQELGLNERSLNALNNLREIIKIIDDFGYSKYVTIDLGMVQSIEYYTGLIFKGFTYGVGFPILSGGRYDTLVGEYGLSMPATGFSLGINMVIDALQRQKVVTDRPSVDVFIAYADCSRVVAFEQAQILREQELSVRMDTCGLDNEAAKEYCEANDITVLCSIDANGDIIMLNVKTGKFEKVGGEQQ